MTLDIRKVLLLLTVPVFFISIAILAQLDVTASFEHPYILAGMNSLFLGIVPLVIAYITYRVVSRSGSVAVFLIGAGVLIFGLGSIAAGWVNPLPDGPNMTVTLHNTCALVGSIFVLAGAVLSHHNTRFGRGSGNPGTIVILTYAGIVVFVTLFIIATLRGMTPQFFIPGSGPTLIRVIILENAILLFALSSVLFMMAYQKSKSDFFFWYSGAFALITIGLISVFVQPSVGSLTGWVGRSAQYLGFIILLYAILIALKVATVKGRPIEEVIANFFVDAEQSYKQLVESANDAIVTFDQHDRILLWNLAAERMFGYTRDEAIGLSFASLAVNDPCIRTLQDTYRDPPILGHDEQGQHSVEIVGKRKNGALFPIELTVSRRDPVGETTITCIIRDLSERKQAEEALRQSEAMLHNFFEAPGMMRGIVEVIADDDVRHIMDNSVAATFIGLTPEVMRNKRGSELGEPRDILQTWISHYNHSRETGKPVTFEYCDKRCDHEVWLSATVSYLETLPEGYPRFAYVVLDISKRKLTEEKLQKAHQRLYQILSGVSYGILLVTGADRIEFVNSAFCDIFGLKEDPSDLVGLTAEEMVERILPSYANPDEAVSRITQIISLGQPVIGEEVAMCGDRTVLRDFIPLPLGENEYSRLWAHQEITKLKQAEEKTEQLLISVQEEKERLSALIQSMNDEVWFADIQKTFTLANPSALNVFGMERINGTDVESFAGNLEVYRSDGSIRPVGEAPPLRSLKGEVVRNEEELVHIPSSGELRYRQVSASPVRDPSGTIIGSVSVVRDITDLKIAEIALRKSEEKFRNVFENTPLGIVTCDAGGHIIDINPAFVHMLGFTQDELRTESFEEFTHPEDIILERPLVEKLIAGEINRYEIEKRYIRKDGQVIWIRLIGSLIHGTDGIPLGIALVEDITERRQVEDHLRNQAEILSVITDAIIIVDTSYRIISWNARAEELYGWKEEQVLGKVAKDILRSEIIGTDRTEIYRQLERGESVSTESVQWTKDDKQIFVKGYTVPLKDALGTITSYVAVNHDITERKKTEAQMAFHAMVLDTMHDAVITTDAGFFITAWNKAAEQMYGWSEEEVLGKNSRDVLRGSMSEDDLKNLLFDLNTKGSTDHEAVQMRKNGSPIVIEARLTTIRDDHGRVIHYIAANRDITTRRQVEERLRLAYMRTSTILEAITDTFYTLDCEWRFTTVNPAAEKAPFGRPATELLGRVIWDLYPALVGTRIHQHYLDAANKQTMEHYESQSPLNGRWYEVFMQGREGGVDVYMRDITERKKIEEALKVSEERFRLALKNAPVSVAVQDLDLVFQWAYNQQTRQPSEIVGRTDADLFAPEDVAWLLPLKKRLLESGTNLHIGDWVTSNGRRLFLDLYFEPIRDENGKINGVGIAAVNLTEQKKAEIALQETTQYLDHLINYANSPIIVWDSAFRITRFNRAFERLTGNDAEEVIGKNIECLFPEKYRKTSMDHIYSTVSGEWLEAIEIPILTKIGEIRTVLWNSATIYTPDGKTILSTIAQGNDITERKMAENDLKRERDDLNAAYKKISSNQVELRQYIRELSQREHQLNEALAEKEILLSEVHHRVKNNLAAFISLLSLEGSYVDNEEGRALRQDLQNRARSMALIHETLYRTGKFSEVDMKIYLDTLVGQIAGSYATGTAIITVVDAGDVVLDLSRATTAGLIINELVTNSFKYAFPVGFDCMATRGEPCTIRVILVQEDDCYMLTVADNGCSLPAEIDPLVVTSLGLKLVNFLARYQLHAEIEVRKDKGTEFIFHMNKTRDYT